MTGPRVFPVVSALLISVATYACSADRSETTAPATSIAVPLPSTTAPISTITTVDDATTAATTTTTTAAPTSPAPTTIPPTTPPTNPPAPYVPEFELTWVAHPPPGPFDPPRRKYDVTVRLVITRGGTVEYDRSFTATQMEGGGDPGFFFTDTPDGINYGYNVTCTGESCTGQPA